MHMPNNTTQPPQNQAPNPQMPPQNMAPQSPQTPHQQQSQGGDTEKMLLQFLKEMEHNITDLNQRVDILENKENNEPQL